MTVASSELEALVRREHSNPHSVLGAHPQNGGVVIRVLRPAANSVTALIDGQPGVELKRIHPGGVFEGVIEDAELPLSYRLEVDYGDAGKYTIHDGVSANNDKGCMCLSECFENWCIDRHRLGERL